MGRPERSQGKVVRMTYHLVGIRVAGNGGCASETVAFSEKYLEQSLASRAGKSLVTEPRNKLDAVCVVELKPGEQKRIIQTLTPF